MAARRLGWANADGQPHMARLDHGAPGFAAQGAEFQAFLRDAPAAAAQRPWTPRLAPGSRPLTAAAPWWLPTPEMPALCRALLQGVALHLSRTVDRLDRQPGGWQLQAGGEVLPGLFDTVLLALPPAQPSQGPLALILRNEGRPGRQADAGEVHWVLQASADWSRQHLEQSPEWVLAQ
jgi:hypothetical protein